MKLRIRSAATKETIRVDASDFFSLLDLKALIASKLSSSASLILPEAIHLSLNRVDEIITTSPRESLSALGLTSGDLLFYSLDSNFYSTSETLISSSISPDETLAPPPTIPSVMDSTHPSLDSLRELPSDDMDSELDSETFVQEKVPSVPCFLQRVLEAEKGNINGNMELSIVAIHALFLESGFVACNTGGGSYTREGSAAHLVSVMYTLPDIVNRGNIDDVRNAIVKFSVVGNHVSIYGYLVGANPDVYHLSLDSSMLAPFVYSSINELGEKEKDGVFHFWKTVKDCLTSPLLIDFCQKNGLPLPPCFTRLPTDLKIMILEFLPGIELAKVACACSELRYLASNDELWRRKFLEEFEMMDARNIGGSWKEKFARFCLKRKKPYMDRCTVFVPVVGIPRLMSVPRTPDMQRFPMSVDYDRFPAIGDLGSLRRVGFNRNAGRRNFSPNCNLGAGGFIM